MLLCVAALPVAIAFQQHLLADIKEGGGGGWGEREVRLHHLFYGAQNMPIVAPTFSPPLFSLFLFCVGDFHEKASSPSSHLRSTSVR